MPRKISHKLALARGLTRYYTGKPCKHGHIAKRRTASRACVDCERISQRRYNKHRPHTPKFHERVWRYNNSLRHRETRYRYDSTPKGRETQWRFNNSAEGHARKSANVKPVAKRKRAA